MKKKQIDATDIEILNILSEHAEVTNKQLSATIGLSEGPTLVRVQNFWQRDVINAYQALINYQIFGYNRYYLIRAEISDNSATELKQRFMSNRHIIIFIELEGSIDIVIRIYLAVCLTKSLKAAKDEVQKLTQDIHGVRSVTFTQIIFAAQKKLQLENTDIIK
jgi:DNA-binding Lrp family transcriptional regulator